MKNSDGEPRHHLTLCEALCTARDISCVWFKKTLIALSSLTFFAAMAALAQTETREVIAGPEPCAWGLSPPPGWRELSARNGIPRSPVAGSSPPSAAAAA